MSPLPPGEADRIIEQGAKTARENAARNAAKSPKPFRAQPVLGGGAVISDDAALEFEQQREHRRREQCAKDLLAKSRIPPRYLLASLDRSTMPNDVYLPFRTAIERAKRLLDRPGILALLGPRGLGKTWIACALAREFCLDGRSARYLHVMDYFIGLKATYGDRARNTEGGYEHDHLRPQLLILDEMHERSDSAWEDRMLTRLIVKRDELQLPTLLLSNDNVETFKNRVGDSIVNRMLNDAGGIHICDWRCLRGEKTR